MLLHWDNPDARFLIHYVGFFSHQMPNEAKPYVELRTLVLPLDGPNNQPEKPEDFKSGNMAVKWIPTSANFRGPAQLSPEQVATFVEEIRQAYGDNYAERLQMRLDAATHAPNHRRYHGQFKEDLPAIAGYPEVNFPGGTPVNFDILLLNEAVNRGEPKAREIREIVKQDDIDPHGGKIYPDPHPPQAATEPSLKTAPGEIPLGQFGDTTISINPAGVTRRHWVGAGMIAAGFFAGAAAGIRSIFHKEMDYSDPVKAADLIVNPENLDTRPVNDLKTKQIFVVMNRVFDKNGEVSDLKYRVAGPELQVEPRDGKLFIGSRNNGTNKFGIEGDTHKIENTSIVQVTNAQGTPLKEAEYAVKKELLRLGYDKERLNWAWDRIRNRSIEEAKSRPGLNSAPEVKTQPAPTPEKEKKESPSPSNNGPVPPHNREKDVIPAQSERPQVARSDMFNFLRRNRGQKTL